MSLQNLVGVSLDTIAPSKQIQTLPLTLGIDAHVVTRLDHLRKQRGLVEYSGETVSEGALNECLLQAETLQVSALAWLKANKPELL